MKHNLLTIFLCCIVLGFCTGEILKGYKTYQLHTSSAWIKANTVQIIGLNGMCSGVKVQMPNGEVDTLTARHCYGVLLDGQGLAIDANGHKHIIKVIKRSKDKDLMLMTGIGLPGIPIAPGEHDAEHIRKFGYSGGKPVDVRSDGILIGKRYLASLGFTFIISNAHCEPGDSGGAVVDDEGRLVGIVNAVDVTGFSYFTPIEDIQAFLGVK